MKERRVFYSEWAYLVGILVLAMGTAMMERADFGVSMVVAPAYLLHLKISRFFPAFTFGMAEYTLQAVLLLLLVAVTRKVRWKYLLSFATAVFYGLVLDGVIWLVSLIPDGGFTGRVVFYLLGLLCCAAGVSALFHTYIAPEAYELFVKEFSAAYGTDIHKTKTVYDCASCLISVVLSFAFFGFGHFEGVKLGTVLCALVNGSCIGLFSRWYERTFTFRDRWNLRKIFE